MNPFLDPQFVQNQKRGWSRRTFLGKSAGALGSLALGSLINPNLLSAAPSPADRWRGVLPSPHFFPKAKRVIHLCMAGGPSQIDLFDEKPLLKQLDGKPFPDYATKGEELAQLQGSELTARGSSFEFSRVGQSGQSISNLLPHIQGIADDICIIRSMHTEQINHDPAHAFMNAGSIIKGRPSMGSWLLYGLGSETQDLPGYIVLLSRGGRSGAQPVSSRQWSAGFLPSKFQGVQFQSKGAAVHYVGSPDGQTEPNAR
jgi:hypothetical protein